jgi:Lrp/AsnC family transcriptional regulator, leucine-responsive regulatory protein
MTDFMRLSRQASMSTVKTEEKVVLDDCDRRILGALTENSRISYRKLAQIANLSANATAERVHRLQAVGIILGFSVEISPMSLGLSLQAFIDVKLQHGTSMEVFEKALRKIPGVREAASVTGSFDARLRVDCKDPTQLGALIEQLRKHTGVQETSSTVICRELQIRSDRS